MRRNKGFTLIEIVIVLIISGILVGLAIPYYMTFMQGSAATATQHNLIAIYNAQKNYYFSNGSYCTTNCSSLTNIDSSSNLNLGITDSDFTNYVCTSASSGITCQATSTNIPVILTINLTKPIVLVGGSGCTTPSGASCNPVCQSTNTSLCPSS